MLYGSVPFKAENMDQLHQQILQCNYTLKDEISKEARDLIKKILILDPEQRATSEDILVHPWLSDTKEFIADVFTETEKERIKKEFSY